MMSIYPWLISLGCAFVGYREATRRDDSRVLWAGVGLLGPLALMILLAARRKKKTVPAIPDRGWLRGNPDEVAGS
jgi:hypothetical protein